MASKRFLAGEQNNSKKSRTSLGELSFERPPSRISDKLFCGAEWNLTDGDRLKLLGIQAILNVADEAIPTPLEGFVYEQIIVADDADADIRVHFARAIAAIQTEQNKGHAVLVISPRCLSRAPTVCIAFLMKTSSISLRDAYAIVHQARPTIRPNAGFFMQLMDYERELRAVQEPSMSLQDYRRGLIKLWPGAIRQVPLVDSSDEDDNEQESDNVYVDDPNDVPVAESELSSEEAND